MSMNDRNGSTSSESTAPKAARRQRFESIFPIIAYELLEYIKGESMPKDAIEWYEKVGQLSTLCMLV